MGKHGQSGRFGEVPLIECKLGKSFPKRKDFFRADNSADKSIDHSADNATDKAAGRFGGVDGVVNIFNKSVFFLVDGLGKGL